MNLGNNLTIALVQMSCGAMPHENLGSAIANVEEAARRGARVVCLPELFRSQYFCQKEDPALFDLAEPVPGPSTEALGKLAGKHNVVIIVPVFERRTARLIYLQILDVSQLGGCGGQRWIHCRPLSQNARSR